MQDNQTPSTGNIGTMAAGFHDRQVDRVLAAIHTTDLPAEGQLDGKLLTSDGDIVGRDCLGQPLLVTLGYPHIETLINGWGPKRVQYADFNEKQAFFSDDEDRWKTRDRNHRKLYEAACCEFDFEEGDVAELLEPHRAYFAWLLGDEIPVCFVQGRAFLAAEDGTDASVDFYGRPWRLTWQSATAIRYDQPSSVKKSIWAWRHSSERFWVYVDQNLNVTYSLEFEQANVQSQYLANRRPKGLADGLGRFMSFFPLGSTEPHHFNNE